MPPPVEAARALLAGAARTLARFRPAGRRGGLVAVLYLVELAARYLRDRQAEAGARLGHVDAWLLPAVEEHLAGSARDTRMERTSDCEDAGAAGGAVGDPARSAGGPPGPG